jgi:hypothetical protein
MGSCWFEKIEGLYQSCEVKISILERYFRIKLVEYDKDY